MERVLYAACPRCGKRADIVSHYWNWDLDMDVCRVKCECGMSEIPYSESRIIPVDVRNPYLRQENFDLLIPEGYDRDNLWNKISKCLKMY